MSPIIDLQRRLREVGRIRLGEQVPTKSGNTRPAKLEKFRFTSADEHAINLVAKEYGGDVRIWDGASVGTQWEVYTESTSLSVLVPPVDLAFAQFMEDWRAGICVARCDRQTNYVNDKSCTCDPDEPVCKPVTRLGLILTAIDGIGIWRLETRGWAAATELNGAIEVLRVVQNRGAMVPARLLLEQRQQKKLDKDGRPATYHFPVPVLDLNLSVAALTAGQAAPARLESGVTPIVRSEPVPSVAEQMRAVDVPVERPKRANAAATLPPTGVKPRAAVPAADRTPGGASPASVRKLMATCRGSKTVPDDDDGRHAWAELALNHPVASFNDLDQGEVSRLIDVASGKEPLIPNTEPDYADDDPQRPF